MVTFTATEHPALPSRHHRRSVRTLLTIAACLGGWPPAFATDAEQESPLQALKALSVEQLMDLEVTSVSRRAERLLQAAAAVEVITGEDIRRSGAPGIPSALRLANSLDVAQENGHEWVVSARGFSSDVGNKLLVLMDGRTLYTPLFSGVFWDRQDYVLTDIDRIEIISGPGGALWGANAVNGVINITTRSAADTQGLLLEAGGGTNPEAFGTVRYGGALAGTGHYRVYAKYSDRNPQVLEGGGDANDGWRTAQGGFRFDAQPSQHDTLTLQGDAYRNDEDIQRGGEGVIKGANVLGRWSRAFSAASDMSLQLYYDRTSLTLPVPGLPAIAVPDGTLQDELDTVDVDFQHRFAFGERNAIVWGLGYRFTHDVLDNAPNIAFLPATLDQHLYSAFVQDQIALGDRLELTIGTKLEHTDYTGFEVEPSIRVGWSFTDQQVLWAAVSRAVRTPSRIDRDISTPAPGALIVILTGNGDFDSEELIAYEAGYRAQLGPRASIAVSAFYNDYDELRSTSISPPDPIFGLPFPFFFENNLEGEAYGVELGATVQLLDQWRLYAGYRVLEEDIRVEAGEFDFNNTLNETNDADQQMTLRSALDLPGNVAVDAVLRWVDTRTVNNSGVATTVPDYVEMDLRVGWRPTETIEVSIAGHNLLDDRHPEFGVPGPGRVEIERSVYGKVVMTF